MKRVLLLSGLLWLGLTGAVAQQPVKWYSIEEAFRLTRSEPRVLVIDVYTDWCGWCKRMEATTFSDPVISEMLNSHFYPVRLNAESREDVVIGGHTYKFVDNGRRGYHELAAIVTKGRLSYPTISYVDHQGRILDAAPGYKTADQFKVYLAYFADDHYKTQTFQEFAASCQE